VVRRLLVCASNNNQERLAIKETKSIAPPVMPEGVRLLAWTPKEPPVALTTWAVVNDVLPFTRTTLSQLDTALRGDNWLAGNWSVRELIDRLGQCGVKVESRPSAPTSMASTNLLARETGI